MNKTTMERFILRVVLACILVALTSPILAQEIELKPAFIQGEIKIGESDIGQALLQVSTPGAAASSTNFRNNPPASSLNYRLTVNSNEEGVSYSVSPIRVHLGAGLSNWLSFLPKTTTVKEGETTTLNFIENNPATIKANATVNGEGVINRFSVTGFLLSNSSIQFNYLATSNPDGSITALEGLAIAGEYRIRCSAGFDALGAQSLPLQRVTLTEGETSTIECNFNTPDVVQEEFSNIQGSARVEGSLPTSIELVFSGKKFHRRRPDENGLYEVLNTPTGSYSIRTNVRFNNNRSVLTLPYSANVPAAPSARYTLTAAQDLNLDVQAHAVQLQGAADISGSAESAETNFIAVRALGISTTDTAGGSASSNVLQRSVQGNYNLFLTEGQWRVAISQMRFTNSSTDPSKYLENFVNIIQPLYSESIDVSRDTNTPAPALSLPTGEVEVLVKTSEATDLTFSSPTLSGICVRLNEQGVSFFRYALTANNLRARDTKIAKVRFVAPEGKCTLDVRATVGGSSTFIGRITLDVIAGTTQQVDVGGPSLVVLDPLPNFLTSNASIDVNGTATDDTGIAQVDINGIAAAISTTGNTDDDKEISFSANVPLSLGPNTLVTRATDIAEPANTTTDSRIVYRDGELPTTQWNPENNSEVFTAGDGANVEISGVANDDAGVESILVNGIPVSFSSTQNPEQINEVSFAADVFLPNGENFVEVTIKDISMRERSSTHKITVVENRPPIANAGEDISVEQTSVAGTPVTLDGLSSADPDNDFLNYRWSGPFGTVTGPTPQVTLAQGENTITLVVNDGQTDSEPDTVTVLVQDTTPPMLSALAEINVEAVATLTPVSLPAPSFSDNGAVTSSPLADNPGPFPVGVTEVIWSLSDDAGNASQVVQKVTVVDSTAPTLTAPNDVTVEATGPNTPVDLGIALADDLVGVVSGPNPNTAGPFSVGIHHVTWSAEDAAGNVGEAQQIVTVLDTTPPTLVAPANIRIEATGVLTPVELGQATANDLVGLASSPSVDNTGPFPLGETVVTWTAQDNAGNQSSATQTIVIEDTTAPAFNTQQLVEEIWPPNNKLVLVARIDSVRDIVDQDTSLEVMVQSNQPVNANDWAVETDGNVWEVYVRAARDGNLGQRDYEITLIARDASGNEKIQSLLASVPHNKGNNKKNKN